MSHRISVIEGEQVDTMRVAKDAIPDGNTCMALRDRLGTIFDDALFVPLFPTRGQPPAPPWRLAGCNHPQFAERLSDRDAAEALRTRIDWKYLLGLELSDSGFDYSILSRFCDRLIEGHAEMSLLDRFLDLCKSPARARRCRGLSESQAGRLGRNGP
jgi:transposase